MMMTQSNNKRIVKNTLFLYIRMFLMMGISLYTSRDYNQISYNVMIWDTNTHNIYTPSKRRELTEKYYPFFGYEYEKPSTKPVKIGSDCWIAQNAAILKGTELEDEVIVGFCTILLGTSIPFGTTVVNKVEYRFV